MILYLCAFLTALTAALVVTPCIRKGASVLGWVDKPDTRRKLHSAPVPRVGGLAIFFSLLIGMAGIYLLPAEITYHFGVNYLRAATVIGLGGMMMLIGFCDDLRALRPWHKFAAQIVVALTAWLLGFRIMGSWSAQGGIIELGILSLPITLLWIVGITNAFNLIDGIDGLSTGAALFAMTSMIVVSALHQQWLSVLLLCGLAGASLGFLRHNFVPASIFLGDSGSLLLGFMLAVLGIESSEKSSTAFAIAVPIVALGLPVLDTLISILRRFLSGKPIFTADRKHIHHILIERGFEPRAVVILLYGVCGLFGLFSLLFMNPSGRTLGLSLTILGVCVWFGIQQLHYPELRELNGYVMRGIQHQRELLAGNVMIGKMIDGFRTAHNLAELLASLGAVLEELDFARAEMRLPGIDENRLVLRVRNWQPLAEGRWHCLYRWRPPYTQPREVREEEQPKKWRPDRLNLGTDFRLEFVFRVPWPHAANVSGVDEEDPRGRDIGRLTFYHPMSSRFPVSAICLLSRNVWSQFAEAITRIMSRHNAGFVRSRTDHGTDAEPEPVHMEIAPLQSAASTHRRGAPKA
jgi:UDP-GlcNAc:undecaprenyl-phosphate/decaprenyl-phosphate GlcNAc-1-phosphate transferase